MSFVALGPTEAALLLDGFGAGLVDGADFLEAPLLVVGGSSRPDLSGLRVPAGFPAVVVVVSPFSAPEISPRGPDVALTGLAEPPAPWVGVPDVDVALADLAERIAACPGAAVTVVELLRVGRGRPVEEGLLAESVAYSMLQAGPEFARWRAGRPAVGPRAESGPALVAGRVGSEMEIVLDRPEVHNAYNRRMRDELCEALAAAAADPQCRVRISGAGPSFCSGGDLDEFGTSPDPVSAHLIRTGRSPARLLAAVSERTQVLLHGACAGSGIELPAFAATVRARPGTRMWLPELAMGLIPGAGGTVSLPGRIGAPRTAWMVLSGRPVDAETGLRWGLIDGIVPD